ncbi:hypothetical protein D2V93_01875 [Flagellimonas taeanensis]|nr:hypothetical protein D2V93_01875 [Allomuricauda taeanensis]
MLPLSLPHQKISGKTVFIHQSLIKSSNMKRQLFIQSYQPNDGLRIIWKRKKMAFDTKFKSKI